MSLALGLFLASAGCLDSGASPDGGRSPAVAGKADTLDGSGRVFGFGEEGVTVTEHSPTPPEEIYSIIPNYVSLGNALTARGAVGEQLGWVGASERAFAVTGPEHVYMHGSYGELDSSSRSKAQWDDTLFPAASLSKMFVSVAVFHQMYGNELYPESAFDTQTRVSSFLPWLETSEHAEITVGELLGHTSGLPREFDLMHSDPDLRRAGLYGPSGERARDALSRTGLVASASVLEQRREAGLEVQKYSNVGYYVLAEFILAVAERRGFVFESETHSERFAQYMEESIFGPLGLDDDLIYSRVDMPQHRLPLLFSDVIYNAYQYEYPAVVDAGAYQAPLGLYATAQGLAYFGQTLLQWSRGDFRYGILGAEEFEEMMGIRACKVNLMGYDSYASGFFVRAGNREDVSLGHFGSGADATASLKCLVHRQFCVVSLSSRRNDTGIGHVLEEPFRQVLDIVPIDDAEMSSVWEDNQSRRRECPTSSEAERADVPDLLSDYELASRDDLRAAFEEDGYGEMFDYVKRKRPVFGSSVGGDKAIFRLSLPNGPAHILPLGYVDLRTNPDLRADTRTSYDILKRANPFTGKVEFYFGSLEARYSNGEKVYFYMFPDVWLDKISWGEDERGEFFLSIFGMPHRIVRTPEIRGHDGHTRGDVFDSDFPVACARRDQDLFFEAGAELGLLPSGRVWDYVPHASNATFYDCPTY